MDLNSLLFPAPSIKYSADNLEGEAIYIPRFMKYNKSHRTILKKKKKSEEIFTLKRN